MEDFDKPTTESRPAASTPRRENFAAPASAGRGVTPDTSKEPASGLVSGSGEPVATDETIWKELKARREKASRRISEGWERVSDNAKGYADDHSIGVALGTLGVGVALGILIGALVARD